MGWQTADQGRWLQIQGLADELCRLASQADAHGTNMETLDWDRQRQPGAEHPFVSPPPSPLKPRQRRQERLQSASHGVVSSTPVLCSCTTVPGMQGTPSVPVASQAQWAGPTPLLLCMGWAGGKGDRPVSNKPWKIRSESSISLNILWSKGSKATNCQNTAQVTQGSCKEAKQMAKAEFTDCTS